MAKNKSSAIGVKNVVANPRTRLALVALGFIGSPIGLNRFYLGHKRLGWIRLGLFLGGPILFFVVPLLGVIPLLGLTAFTSALLWGIVDFFVLYKRKIDIEGAQLQTTPRDEKWIKALLIGMVVNIVIGTFLTVGAINLGLSFLEQIRKNPELYSSANR